MYKVYDDNKLLLASFDTKEAAARYVYNNDDIASYINEERVTAAVHVPVDAAPINTVQKAPKLLNAAQALQRLKTHFEGEIETIIEQLILEEGMTTLHPDTHKLVIKQLKNLGYIVDEHLNVYLPLEDD